MSIKVKIIKISFVAFLIIILLTLSVFFIAYRLGIEHTEYPPCELVGCKIILHSTFNNNSFRSNGYYLGLEISNDSGITNTFEIGSTLGLKVKVEGVSLLKNERNRVILVISTLNSSDKLFIEKENLTLIKEVDDISEYGEIINKQTLLLPCSK